jgi:hypothetical protein
LTGGAATALAFPVVYAASGLAWALDLPFGPWLDQLVSDHWPLPLVAQLAIAAGGFVWAPAVA